MKKIKKMPVVCTSLGAQQKTEVIAERSLDFIYSPGCYAAKIDHTSGDVGLPFGFCSNEHYFTATLIVTESGTDGQLQNNRMIGQTLILPACDDGRTRIFTRTQKKVNGNYTWSDWRILAQTGMDDEITNTEELVASVTELMSQTEDIKTNLLSETVRTQEAEASINKNAILSGSLNINLGTDSVTLAYRNIDGSETSEVDIPAATTENAGVMSAEDKEKLDNSESLLIYLKGISSSGTLANVSKVGDVFYNTETNLLRRCTEFNEVDISQNKYETVPFNTQGVFVYINRAFKWDDGQLSLITENSVEYSVIKGYSIKSSVPTESPNYSYSSPIRLFKGQTINVIMYSSAVWGISRTNADGTLYEKLVETNSVDNPRKYEYTADMDCYVAVCWKHNIFPRALGVEVKGDEIAKTIKYIDKIQKATDTIDNKQITIVGYGDRGTTAGISMVGETYLSPDGILRKCISFNQEDSSQNAYESVPFMGTSLYVWDNSIYKWDGSTLVSTLGDAVDFNVIKGYSIKSSTPTESGNYSYSSPILLKKGDKIITRLLGSNVWAIAETDEGGSTYSKLIEADTVLNYKEYSYTATNDMYVALCWRNTVFEKPIGTRISTDTILLRNNVDDISRYIDTIHNINIPMQGGKLNSSTGYMQVATDNRDDFTMYIHSVFYYNVKSIESVELEENEFCKIFCFDDKYKFIGLTNDLTIKEGTEWIKFEITNTEEYKKLRNIKSSIKGFLKTSLNVSANTTGMRHFSFEVQEPLIEQENGSATGQYINKRRFDNGFVMLPPNYDPSGVPVPLIIFWHGTGGYDFANKDTISYKDYLTFLTYNGYAVADCSGMSDKYQIGEHKVAGHDCRMNPMALSCFKGLYDFISKNYNIKRDGAYVFGKSNGGLGTVMLGYTQPFPIKALGSLAGSLSLVASFRYSSAVNLNYWLKQFGVEADYDFVGYLYQNQTQDIIEYLSSNANRYSNFDPMTIGTDIDAVEFARLVFDNGYINHTMNGEALLDMVNSTKKFLPKPIKIWHAEDDEAVPIETSEFFKTMVDNLHGICYLRKFPSGCGGHHAVDNSTLAPKTIYTTKYNGDVEIPVAYAELVEWFNQW